MDFIAESANGKNTNYYGDGEQTNPKDGDLWYYQDGNEKEMYQYHNQRWEPIASSKTSEEISQKVADATADLPQIKTDISTSLIKADLAISNIAEQNTELLNIKTDFTSLQNATSEAKTLSNNAISQANQSMTQAQTALANAQDTAEKLGNMEIGGRNYLIGSKDWSINHYGVGTTITVEDFDKETKMIHAVVNQGSTGNGVVIVMENTAFNRNEDWAFSAGIKGTGKLRGLFLDSSIPQNFMDVDITADWKRYANFGKGTGLGLFWTLVFDTTNAPADVYIKLPKVEKGTVPTEYSPAPEDIQVQIDNINGELSTKVSQKTFDSLTGRVSSAETLATQNKSLIEQKASQTDVNTLTGLVNTSTAGIKNVANELLQYAKADTVNTLTGQVTSLQTESKLNADGLATTVSRLDNLQVGGVNLVAGTSDPFIMGYGISSTTWQDNAAYAQLPITILSDEILPQGAGYYHELKKGETYTQSIWLETDATFVFDELQVTWWTTAGHDAQPAKVIKLSENQYKIISTYTWPGKSDNNVRLFDIYSLGQSFDIANSGSYLKFTNLKLEKGNVSTDYSPAPEDAQTAITQVKQTADYWGVIAQANQSDIASLKVTASQLQTNIADKVSQTQLTQTADKLSVAITEVQNTRPNQYPKSQIFDGDYTSSNGTATIEDFDENTKMLHIVAPKSLAHPSFTDIANGFEDGGNYVISDDMKGTGVVENMSMMFAETTTAINSRLTSNWVRYSDSGKLQASMPAYFSITFDTSDEPVDVYIKLIKVENNAVATPWAPALTDSGMATATDVANLQIVQNAISAAVQNAQGSISQPTQRADSIQTAVEDKVGKMELTQTANQLTASISDLQSDTGVAMSLLQDSIDLRVQKGDLLSEINTQAGKILISSDKLYLDADTVAFSGSAFIPSVAITDLSADKLTAGTIDANTINLINLNGANITAQSITADKFAANAIQVGLSNWGNSLQLQPNMIYFVEGQEIVFQLDKTGMRVNNAKNHANAGWIHTNTATGHDEIFGLNFDLNHKAHFMSWGYQGEDAVNANYSIKFAWWDSYSASVLQKPQGFEFTNPVTIRENIYGRGATNGGSSHLHFDSGYSINGHGNGIALINDRNAGIVICDDTYIGMSNGDGNWYDVMDIMRRAMLR